MLKPRVRGAGARCARRERGSISVELVVLVPGLVALLLLLAAGARVVEVQGHIDGAARDAARAASLARTFGDAQRFAQQAAQADLGSASWCERGSVQVPPPTGFPAGPGLPPPGSAVTVTVTCLVDTSPFAILGFGGSTAYTGRAVAPLDPFVCRGAGC